MSADEIFSADEVRSSSSDEVRQRISFYDSLAYEYNWVKIKIKTQNDAKRQRYKQNSHDGDGSFLILDCWPTTKTIGSYLRHPTQGKTQLFRKECTDEDAIEIFHNPRSHTGKGYHRNDLNTDANRTKRGRDRDNDVEMVETENVSRQRKRRRVACKDGPKCRNWSCEFFHPPRCFYAAFCWFQPNCWFDHTHGLCRNGVDCTREDCWFSHRNPNFYY